jgi:hypothetical protein
MAFVNPRQCASGVEGLPSIGLIVSKGHDAVTTPRYAIPLLQDRQDHARCERGTLLRTADIPSVIVRMPWCGLKSSSMGAVTQRAVEIIDETLMGYLTRCWFLLAHHCPR